jgi:hypothetical protein
MENIDKSAEKAAAGSADWSQVQSGWQVYDKSRSMIGKASDVAKHYLFIKDSPQLGEEIYIPKDLIDHIDIVLKADVSELQKMDLFSAGAVSPVEYLGPTEWVQIERGWQVYDSGRRELGNVAEVADKYIMIRLSILFGRDLYVPKYLVGHIGMMGEVMLRVSANEIATMDLFSAEKASAMMNEWEKGQST